MDNRDKLAQLLARAFPDDAKKEKTIYHEALDNPRLAKELLRAAELSAVTSVPARPAPPSPCAEFWTATSVAHVV